MPHILVKLLPGRTEEQKKELTDKIVQAVKDTVNAGESSISVSFEETPNETWEYQVYKRRYYKEYNNAKETKTCLTKLTNYQMM
ncbi:tautomerase family protein [Bacillus sp. OTU530]|uniref:tautomerase family protein n=1 Tax=Bacillus sp. OTU530 TaxID=3043862 RepID=UPI00313BB733